MKRCEIILASCLFFITALSMDKINKDESSEDSDIILPIPDKPSRSLSAPHMPPAPEPNFHLNLQNISHSEPQRGISDSQRKTPKTPIPNCEDLYQEIKRAKSVRSLPKRAIAVGTVTTKPINGTNGSSNNSDFTRKDKSPSSGKKRVSAEIIEKVEDIFGSKFINGTRYYSEDEVWNAIEIANPVLYAIAQNNNMNLDEAIDFAELVEKFDLGPQVFRQIAQGANALQPAPSSLWQRIYRFISKDPEEYLDKKWSNIRKEEPDLYLILEYHAIKEAMDHTENKIRTSPIKDRHIDFQREEIKQLAIANSQQKLATAVTVLLAIGGWVFGFVGQLVQPGNNS